MFCSLLCSMICTGAVSRNFVHFPCAAHFACTLTLSCWCTPLLDNPSSSLLNSANQSTYHLICFLDCGLLIISHFVLTAARRALDCIARLSSVISQSVCSLRFWELPVALNLWFSFSFPFGVVFVSARDVLVPPALRAIESGLTLSFLLLSFRRSTNRRA